MEKVNEEQEQEQICCDSPEECQEESCEQVKDNGRPTPDVEEGINPIFNEIQGMSVDGAISVIIQAAQMSQHAGALTIRDSVMLAKAISTLRPGSI